MAMESLIELGVNRVLTSGQKATALEGLDLLKSLKDSYEDQIEVLVGSGVQPVAVGKIYRATGIKNFHGSSRGWREDGTTIGKVSYAYGGEDLASYEVVDGARLKRLVKELRTL